MPEVASLQVVVGADTSQAESALSGFSSKMGGLLSTGAVAAGAAVAGGLAVAVKSAADFEKQLSAISAVSGATQQELEGIRSTALQLGKDTSFSASEAAAGMEELIKAGVSLGDVMGGAGRAALDLAAAGAVSTTEAATIMSTAMNTFSTDAQKFGSNAEFSAHAADILAGAANASATDIHELGFGLSSVGNVAATMGASFDDTATALAVFAQNGLKGSDAGTSLKTMLLNLSPSTDKAQAEMNKLGLSTFNTQAAMDLLRSKGIEPVSAEAGALSHQIATQIVGMTDFATATDKQHKAYDDLIKSSGVLQNAFFQNDGSMKSMADISQTLQDAMQGLSKEEQIMALKTMFGTDAVRAAAIMAKAGATGFNDMAASMSKVTAQAVAEERLNNLWGSVEKLKGSLETGAIILGSLFLPALKRMADAATETVNTIVDALEQIPDVIETVRQVFAGDWAPDASVRPFTLAVGEAAIVVRDNFGPAIMAAGAFITDQLVPALQAAATFFAAHPQLIAAVVVAFGTFVILTTVVGWITSAIAAFGALSAAITAAGGVAGAVVAVLGGPLTLAIAAIAVAVGVLYLAWTQNWFGIQEITASAWATISTTFAAIIAGYEQMAVAVEAWVTSTVSAITTWTTEALASLGAAMTAIGELFQAGWDGLVALFQSAIATLTALWDAGWALLQQTAANFWAILTPENQARVQELIALITQLWAMLPQLWTAGTTAVTTIATAWWAVLTALWTTSSTAVTTETTTWWTAMQTAWTTATAAIALAATAWWEVLTTLWTTSTTAISTETATWWTAIEEAWTTATTAIGDAVGAKWAEIVTATSGMFTRLQEAFTKAITDLGTAATEIGGAVVKGIVDAINSGVGMVADALIAMVKGAIAKLMPAIPGLASGGGGGGGSDDPQAYLRQAALARGIDPEQVAKVMMKEGPTGWGAVGSFPTGTSYGPLQLHYAGGVNPQAGMGDAFTAATGIDLRTDKSLAAQQKAIDYALDQLSAKGNYSDWYGADTALGSRFTSVARVPPQVIAAQRKAAQQINQMSLVGDTLTMEEAKAFCGPAAAMWFAGMYGRAPTKAEAESLARQVGWTEGQGMLGPASEQALLQAMGVPANLDMTPTAEEIAALAGQNVPFMLSTAGHYYQVQGGGLGGLNVGGSGVAPGGSATMSLDQITAMSGAINAIITLAPQMGQALTAASAEGGAALGGLLTSTTNLGNGFVMTTQLMGNDVVVAITNAAGEVVNQWSTATATVSQQTAQLAAEVPAQMEAMSAMALTSVTNLGTGMMTITTDTAGSTIATIADMSGQVTSQTAQLANGVVLQMGAMEAGTLTSVTNLGTGVMTTVSDMSGNTVTTITDMAGNVTAQYTNLASAVPAQAQAMAAGSTAAVESMSGAVVSITENAAGEVTATVTGLSEDVVAAFEAAGSGAEEAYAVMEDVPSPDYGDIVDGLKDVQEAAEEAADALDDVGSGDGGGDDGDGDKHRALGGPVSRGEPYMVGEHGPEMFVPGQSGSIIPNSRLDIDYRELSSAIAAASGPSINVYGAGTEEVLAALRRERRRQSILRGLG